MEMPAAAKLARVVSVTRPVRYTQFDWPGIGRCAAPTVTSRSESYGTRMKVSAKLSVEGQGIALLTFLLVQPDKAAGLVGP